MGDFSYLLRSLVKESSRRTNYLKRHGDDRIVGQRIVRD